MFRITAEEGFDRSGLEPFTRDPQPKPVWAWERFGETAVTVDAEVCSWTPHAVGIRFTVAGGEFKPWV